MKAIGTMWWYIGENIVSSTIVREGEEPVGTNPILIKRACDCEKFLNPSWNAYGYIRNAIGKFFPHSV